MFMFKSNKHGCFLFSFFALIYFYYVWYFVSLKVFKGIYLSLFLV